VEKKDGKLTFDFEGKVLGTGSITMPIIVRAVCFSEKAKEKLKAAGGSAVEKARLQRKPSPLRLRRHRQDKFRAPQKPFNTSQQLPS